MTHLSGNATWTNTSSTVIDLTALENFEGQLDRASAAVQTTWVPADHGLIAWTSDPLEQVSSGTNSMGGGVFIVSAIKVGTTQTCTGCVITVNAAGATLTSGQSKVVLYNATGTQVAITADQSTNWTSTGNKQIPWVSSFGTTPQIYYAGIVSNGTTPPSLVGGDMANNLVAEYGVGTWRAGFIVGVTTTIPSTRPSLTGDSTGPIWTGLY